MKETEAAILQAIRSLQLHSGNPWRKELQAFLARAEAGEDITIEVIDLLSPNENVRRWMREQVAYSEEDSKRSLGFRSLPGSCGSINANNVWFCPLLDCSKSLPVIREGEDPPTCEVHLASMIRRKSQG